MFKTIQNNPPTNNLWIISFRTLCFRQEDKAIIEECFPNELDEDSMIIYNTSDEGFVVLGYYKMDSQNITTSSMYDQLRNEIHAFCHTDHIDNTEELTQVKCGHLCSWVFDISLRNKECLNKICNAIYYSASPSYFLWYEGKEGLVFYPRNRKQRTLDCFVNAFMKE